MRFIKTLPFVSALVLVAALATPRAANAQLVEPTLVDDNPSCESLGLGEFEYKVDPPNAGTYNIDGFSEVVVITDGTFLEYHSTIGFDAVIVKGGPNANVYEYPYEVTDDAGLHSPLNPSGGWAAISHISFCYDYELDAQKTTATSFTRTHLWDIDKSVNPEAVNFFVGDAAEIQFTINVTATGFVDSDFAMTADLVIFNNTPFDTVVTAVTGTVSPDIAETFNCGVLPTALPSGGSLYCGSALALPNGDARVNTAVVETDPASVVRGTEATAPVDFSTASITHHNPAVTVTDDFLPEPLVFSGSGSFAYTRTVPCAEFSGADHLGFTVENTAVITQTQQSDSAVASFDCYRPGLTKTASTAFTREFDWMVEKVAEYPEVLLSPGQQLLVGYSVTPVMSFTDLDHQVAGSIVATNPNPVRAAELVSILDEFLGNNATVSCPALAVPPAGSLTCTYVIARPDATSGTNVATATLQNYLRGLLGDTPAGTTAISASAPVDFSSAAIAELDACATFTDSYAGALGTVCAGDPLTPFTYSRWIGPYTAPDDCGEHFIDNVAYCSENDSGTTHESSWVIRAEVACDEGCTLTPGYWKTHSSYGPAPYDDAWELMLPAAADTPFFISGMSYYEVLWTPPAGNAYFILAHAYAAAEMNILDGASIPGDVADDMTAGADILSTYTPDDMAGLHGKTGKDLRLEVIRIAEHLDAYNNGELGPGHCTE